MNMNRFSRVTLESLARSLLYITTLSNFFIVSINEMLIGSSQSLNLLFIVALFAVIGAKLLLSRRINLDYAGLVGLVVVAFSSLLSFLIHNATESGRLVAYSLVALSLAAVKLPGGYKIVASATKHAFFVFVCVGSSAWFYYFIVQGQTNNANFSHAMFFFKQEYTIAFVCFLGVLFAEVNQNGRSLKSMLGVIAVIIIGFAILQVKSVLFILILACPLIFMNRNRPVMSILKGAIAVLCLIFIMLELSLLGVLPGSVAETVVIFRDILVGSASPAELHTLFLRIEIYRTNLSGLQNDWVSFLFGTGVTHNLGTIESAEGRLLEVTKSIENGYLYLWIFGGFLALLMFVCFFLRSIKAVYQLRDDAIEGGWVVLFLMISNLFQDNVGLTLWIFLGIFFGARARHKIYSGQLENEMALNCRSN